MVPKCVITLEVNKTIQRRLFVISVPHFALSLCCRQHIMEDVLCDRLFFCSPAEYGGMGGGEMFYTHYIHLLVNVFSCPD